METRRLKNIAILILLLLNAFLLLLLGIQQLQSRQTQNISQRHLAALFSTQDLALSPQVELTAAPLPPLQLSRDEAAEADMAACILGGETAAVSEGGGIYSYTTAAGTLRFRSGGSFESSSLSLPVEDAQQFVRQFCGLFGYGDIRTQHSGDETAITATRYISGVPVDGCTVTFLLRGGTLLSAAGSQISLEGAAADDRPLLSRTSALVRFLDHRRDTGIVCRSVESVSCIYQLQTSPSRRLVPFWVVATDTHTYLVDCLSGQISRR